LIWTFWIIRGGVLEPSKCRGRIHAHLGFWLGRVQPQLGNGRAILSNIH
jgi:hypothetical protein